MTEVTVVGDTLRQNISNCFQAMDIFLTQEDNVIVSSMIVPEKEALYTTYNIADSIVKILGIHVFYLFTFQTVVQRIIPSYHKCEMDSS